MPAYATLSDMALSRLVQRADEQAFWELSARYQSLVESKATLFRGSVLEQDDLLQEGRMGLYRAAITYSAEKPASFRTYAGVCIKNAMIDALRKAIRQQQIQQSQAEPITEDPALSIETAESDSTFHQKLLLRLSPLETAVLKRQMEGKPYTIIAKELAVSYKAVENAMARIRKKVKALLAP